mmetsp:Transcript_5502/g.13162  ORF Transcript_5502/g.13162 Transcript_5502/m.13162 type:complete len:264 (+) Transcript_5502:432-1223(+)
MAAGYKPAVQETPNAFHPDPGYRPHPRAQRQAARRLPRAHRQDERPPAWLRTHGLRQCGPCGGGPAVQRQAAHRGRESAPPRRRHRLQRHAVGASTLRELSRPDPCRGAAPGCDRAGGWRRAGHVRRRDAGTARHGAEPVLARHHRHGHGHRTDPRCLRCGPAAGHLRQDRAGPADRRPAFWPFALRLRAGRADELGHLQQRQGQGARALCAGQGRPRRAAQERVRRVSRCRHLHLLRHRQQQPDAVGGHGPAHAGQRLRASA